jgi:predicted GNAT family N-acyltransferase
LDEFISLVSEGGAISARSIERKLPRVERVAFIERDGRMVAVAAIKSPSREYAEGRGTDSGYPLSGDLHELGYVAVSCEWRGLHFSSKVVAGVLSEFGSGELFATTSSAQMKFTLANHGFKQVGREWDAKRQVGQKLSLWIRKAKQ